MASAMADADIDDAPRALPLPSQGGRVRYGSSSNRPTIDRSVGNAPSVPDVLPSRADADTKAGGPSRLISQDRLSASEAAYARFKAPKQSVEEEGWADTIADYAGDVGDAAAAFGTGAVDGVPMVGPFALGAVEHAAAALAAPFTEDDYWETLDGIQNYRRRVQDENPGWTMAGNVAGDIASSVYMPLPKIKKVGEVGFGIVSGIAGEMAKNGATMDNAIKGGVESVLNNIPVADKIMERFAGKGTNVEWLTGKAINKANQVLKKNTHMYVSSPHRANAAFAAKKGADALTAKGNGAVVDQVMKQFSDQPVDLNDPSLPWWRRGSWLPYGTPVSRGKRNPLNEVHWLKQPDQL